ncbi:MAG: hypothetical protein MRZ79_20435 [Bacteroidia bacterium]|nr:hypothetical protein [Bacteroidia bacterium]
MHTTKTTTVCLAPGCEGLVASLKNESLNYDEAAISIYKEDWTIAAKEDGDCYTFKALPHMGIL